MTGGAAIVCTTCGTGLPNGARFCAECGTPVTVACHVCGSELTSTQKFCPQCGTPAAPPSGQAGRPPAGPVAERRVTSVLFGDLVGFTTLSESRDPEEVRELLGRYFDTAREIVARYGGTIEKFIGDAVMAVWGVPSAHEDDAERAVRAGIDLAEAVAAFGESVRAPGLAMRVGVVTGEVAVTLGASGQGMVAGDAVNTAARLQARADPGAVWVDAQTRSLAAGSIDFSQVGWHELKGKAEPVELFAATAVMGGIGGDRSTDRVQAPLVGRRRELSVLKEMFHVAAEEARPRLVILSGDAGVGKTRLSWELENYLDGLSAKVLWHRGRCLAYGEGVGFSALTSAVRGRIGATDDDTEAATRGKLTRSLETYVEDPGVRNWLLPALANLLGLAGASGTSREDLFSAWLTWFEQLPQAEGDSVVWVVDDAHYADDGLLDFIEHLCTVAQVGLLVVLLARPELLTRRPTLAALRRANVIGLETLSRTDIAALFDGLVEGLPRDVRDALVARAEGNPLYAIETVRAMHDQALTVDGPTRRPGAVRLATGVDATRLNALAAPASLQVLVASRLDMLPTRERSLLAAASVLGQTFTRSGLQAVTDLPEDELAAALRELIGRDLLTTVTDRLSSEEGQYAFVQTVVRMVAYQTQSKRDRLQRHLAVVEHLEGSADSDGGLSAVIAQHLRDAMAAAGPDDPQRGELAARLGGWLQRAAARSLTIGAPSEAMRAYAEALALAVEPADEIRLHLATANAALDAGAFGECLEHAQPIAAGHFAAGPADVASAVALTTSALRLSGRIEQSPKLFAPYLDDGALDALPVLVAAKLSREISAVFLDSGELDPAMAWTERALRLAEDAGDAREIAHGLNGMALMYYLRNLPRVGNVVLELAAEFARKNQLRRELGRSLVNKVAFGLNRDLAAALEAGREAMSVNEQTGSTNMSWHVAINQAIGLGLAGAWDEVGTLRDRPLLRERPPERAQEAILSFQIAIIAFARDEPVDLAELDELAAIAEAGHQDSAFTMWHVADRAMHARIRGDREVLVAACRRLVDVALRHVSLDDDFPYLWTLAVGWMVDAQDYAGARELLRSVADVPPTRLSPLLVAQLPRLRGTIEAFDPASTCDPAVIERDLLEGIALLDAFGAVPDRGRAQAALGIWLAQHGRSEAAVAHLAAARDTFAELRAAAWLRDLDAAVTLSAVG
ncbi:MAG TPA: adenylate/guanylate cyclase domain-containing protein [Jatrophihabitans sp.]|nr:adenylate/guanylate cyclase domain-containing protein [Jatrophihabitans sp.]